MFAGGAAAGRQAGTVRGRLHTITAQRPTAARLLPNPFSERPGIRLYRTGDLGRWNEHATLEFGGEANSYPPVNAETLALASVEAALLHHPELRETAVTRWTNPAGEEQVVAYISADTKALPGVESLCETARTASQTLDPATVCEAGTAAPR